MPNPLLRTCCFAVLVGSVAFAQVSVSSVQQDIDKGAYTLAAQVSGPTLVGERPDDPEAHYLHAYALYLTGDTAQARAALDRAAALNPPPKDVRYPLLDGLLRAAAGDTGGAEQLLRDTFASTQAYAVATAWAQVAWQRGDYESALEAYTAAAQTEQGSSEVWSYLGQGRMLKALERYEESIAAFEQAIDVFEANDPGDAQPNPGYVEAFFRIGEVYETLGDVEQARAFYAAARGADPNYTPAVVALERLGP